MSVEKITRSSVWNDFYDESQRVLNHIEKIEKENEKLREALEKIAYDEDINYSGDMMRIALGVLAEIKMRLEEINKLIKG